MRDLQFTLVECSSQRFCCRVALDYEASTIECLLDEIEQKKSYARNELNSSGLERQFHARTIRNKQRECLRVGE